ncbi:hypothetical protein FACS1894145_1670 [Bacteroidia bacterium]|nr:hypothetical protein FACS1894145_1670 [Bacteroidia bacterium]
MREKMKKMLFLMLFLIILGAANVSAQVRIGGNGQPNPAAVLDLNADNTVTGTKGLALPRVSLTDINTALTGSPTVNGMLVYNTNTALGAGVYYWDTNKWIKVMDGSFVEGDVIVGNELTDTIANGGLTKTGAGTADNPYKVGIKTGGVTSDMIVYHGIGLDRLNSIKADSGRIIGSDGTQWQSVSMPKLYYSFAVLDTAAGRRSTASGIVGFRYPADSLAQLTGCPAGNRLIWPVSTTYAASWGVEVDGAWLSINRLTTTPARPNPLRVGIFCYVN